MTPDADFRDLVRRLREAQRRYFARRTQEDLVESKRLEREVDQALGLEGRRLFKEPA